MKSNMIKLGWEEYVEEVLEGTTEYNSIFKHQTSFMAGAYAAFNLVDDIIVDKELSNTAKNKLIDSIGKEINDFLDEIRRMNCEKCPDRDRCTEKDC